jgi:hypothetical protein
MVYLKCTGAGIATSILFVVGFAVIVAVLNRNQEGMVGINIFSRVPMALAVAGFAAGLYLVFRNSN